MGPVSWKPELDEIARRREFALRMGGEEIIDPRDTRPLLIDWARRAYEMVDAELGEKTRGFRP